MHRVPPKMVPNNDRLMMEALKHLGVDLFPFQQELQQWDATQAKEKQNKTKEKERDEKDRKKSESRADILNRARTYYVENRCGNIGNGIINGRVKRNKFISSAVSTHIGHSEWAWTYRQHPTFLEIAQFLVGPGELRCGFDSVNVGGDGNKSWFHVDVNQWPYQKPIEQEGSFSDVSRTFH